MGEATLDVTLHTGKEEVVVMIVMVVAVGGGGGDGGARSLDTCLRKVKRNLLGRNSPIMGDKD